MSRFKPEKLNLPHCNHYMEINFSLEQESSHPLPVVVNFGECKVWRSSYQCLRQRRERRSELDAIALVCHKYPYMSEMRFSRNSPLGRCWGGRETSK